MKTIAFPKPSPLSPDLKAHKYKLLKYEKENKNYSSFEPVILYIKNLPLEQRTATFMKHIRKNLEKSPSYKQLLRESFYEESLLEKIDRYVEEAEDKEVKKKQRRKK